MGNIIISNEQIKKDTEKEIASLKEQKIKITDRVLN